MKYNVFVYGTLKYPDVLNNVLGRDYRGFFYPAQFYGPYRLYDLGLFPALCVHPTSSHIHGRIISVDEYDLKLLDRYESVDSGLYTRQLDMVKNCVENKYVDAFVYIGSNDLINEKNKMTTGIWYRNEKTHEPTIFEHAID